MGAAESVTPTAAGGGLGNPDAAGAVEVVYALPDRQRVVTLALPSQGLTAGEAVERSGLLEAFPQIRQQPLALGIYGVQCAPDRVLSDGDRVEIYRPLGNDPKALRRERATAAGTRRGRRR